MKRPLSGFRAFKPTSFTYGGGDPTFLTPDGAVFNVNFPGQYLVYQTDFLVVQCIIDCIAVGESSVNVIKKMIFKILDESEFILEVSISNGKLLISVKGDAILPMPDVGGGAVDGVELYIEYTDTSENEMNQLLHKAVDLTFAGQVRFSVRAVENTISHSGRIPSNFHGKVTGLMGNFDGNASNDFVTSSNLQLPALKNSREIYNLPTKEIEWEFTKSWSFKFMTSNRIVQGSLLQEINQYVYSCHGDQRKDDSAASIDDVQCIGFTDIHTYEICMQQQMASVDSTLTNAITQDLLRARTNDLTSAALPPQIQCNGNLLSYHGEVTSLVCSTEVFSRSSYTIVLRDGHGMLTLVEESNKDSLKKTLTYSLQLNSTDPTFALPPGGCTSTIKLAEPVLPRYLRTRFALDIVTNSTPPQVISSYSPLVIACFCEERSQCRFQESSIVYNDALSNPSKDHNWLRIASCACPEWKCGQWCEQEAIPCTYSPCYPGAPCFKTLTSSYECGACPNNMTGDGLHCTSPRCSDLKNSPDCEHSCSVIKGEPVCMCPNGKTLGNDHLHCEDVDECDDNPLLCKQFKSYCKNTLGSFTCECQPGFQKIYKTNDENDFICEDVDECKLANGGCGMRCINNYGSYSCSCPSGFQLSEDDKECDDINECEMGNECSQNCKNLYGRYECSCSDGYTLDPNKLTCSGIELCTEDVRITKCGKENTVCSIKDGSSYCGCKSGYQLSGDRRCVNINECIANNDICQDHAQCVDSEGSFDCLCDDGYEMSDGSAGCTNIDECVYQNGGCNQKCTDTDGSHLCSCFKGYILSIDGASCIDVDECGASILSNCHALADCENLPGSYVCTCHDGLTGNGIICNDIDECRNLNGGCPYSCVNTEKSFHCTCPEGFQLDVDRKTCVDIDECSRPNLNGCRALSSCNNISPHYICACPTGYLQSSDGGNITCVMKTEMLSIISTNYELKFACDTCHHGCVLGDDESITCLCGEGYALADDKKTCNDIDECKSAFSFCGDNTLCINEEGGFICECLDGYQPSDEYKTRCESFDDFIWSSWQRWSECPADCDYDLERRSRTCSDSLGESSLCVGNYEDLRVCALSNCDVIPEEEDQSIHMIFASISMLDWLKDMRYGIGFWVSEALLKYCRIEGNFPHCCGGQKPTSNGIIPSQIIANADDIVINGYPRILPKDSGIEIKLAAALHKTSKFCLINSDNDDVGNHMEDTFMNPKLLLDALVEFNNTNNEVYMKYQPSQMKIGRNPPEPQPLKHIGFYLSTAAVIIFCSAWHAYHAVKTIRRARMKKSV